MKIKWHESAVIEFDDAALYYGAVDSELGERFASATEVAVAEIKALPLLARKWDDRARKVRVRRFPYVVIYWVDEETLHIVGVMHLHREPGYWRNRLPQLTSD
jgi:mRNA-degrading endonuclease RelE of RelBE toxin-antitoxin system